MPDERELGDPAGLALRQWCLVIAFTAVLYAFNLGGAQSLTEHEIYVAAVAKQMAAEGDWLLPRIGDHPWLEKPPLIHWVVGGLGMLWGFSEAVVRLPSVLAGLGVVLIVTGLCARLFGTTVGLVAGLVQASTLYMIRHARLAEVDMLLALLVVGAVAAFARLQSIGARTPDGAAARWQVPFWALLGLTNWCKGPLFGAVLILGPCLGWLALRRDARAWARLWSPVGITLAVALAVAWPLLAVARTPSALEVLRLELFGRATGEMAPFNKPVWYYLVTWPVQLLPWTLALLIGAGPSLRRCWRDPASADRFFWCWAALPLLILSVPRAKHHHYLIHALPATAPIMALGLLRCGEWSRRRGPAPRPRAGPGIAAALLAAATTAGVAWHVHATRRADVDVVDVLLVGALVTSALIALDTALARRRPRPAFAVLLATVAAAVLYVHGWAMPRHDPSAADRDFLRSVSRQAPAGARLFAVGGPEIARHIFYIDRPLEACWTVEAIAGRVRHGETFYLVGRGRVELELSRFGTVERVMQSRRTRAPRMRADQIVTEDPGHRFTLFRIDGGGRRANARP